MLVFCKCISLFRQSNIQIRIENLIKSVQQTFLLLTKMKRKMFERNLGRKSTRHARRWTSKRFCDDRFPLDEFPRDNVLQLLFRRALKPRRKEWRTLHDVLSRSSPIVKSVKRFPFNFHPEKIDRREILSSFIVQSFHDMSRRDFRRVETGWSMNQWMFRS